MSLLGKSNQTEEDEEYHDLKVQTMYNMVHLAHVDKKRMDKKVLYLTNKQAESLNANALLRCIEALDLGEPKFIICLLPSLGTKFGEIHQWKFDVDGATPLFNSEIIREDEIIVDSEIMNFMKAHLLRIAIKTKALVLVSGSEGCSLSSAFSEAVATYKEENDSNCPFTVVAVANEFEIHHQAVNNPSSVASKIKRFTPDWSARMAVLNETYGEKTLPRCDLIRSADRYIIFESLDFPSPQNQDDDETIPDKLSNNQNDNDTAVKQNTQCCNDFHCEFIFHFAKRLPSIAIQAFYCGLGIEFLKRLAIKDIPVLFLDSYERSVTSNYPNLTGPRTQMANTDGKGSFPEIDEKFLQYLHSRKKGQLTFASRLKILKKCVEMERKRSNAQYQHGVNRDYYQAATIAFLKSALLIGSFKEDLSPPSLGKKIYDYEKAVFITDVDDCLIPNELAAFVVKEMILPRLEMTNGVLFHDEGHFPQNSKLNQNHVILTRHCGLAGNIWCVLVFSDGEFDGFLSIFLHFSWKF
jgi:hypothetical protein